MTARRLPEPPAGARRAQRILEQALDLDEESQAVFVERACGEDRSLREEVEGLIRALGRARTKELFPVLDRRAFGEAAPDELRPGDRIGRHVIVGRVGKGGAGTVYAAYDTALERKIALKVLSAARGDPTAASRLVAEASAMARVNHPNVVTVHEVGVEDGLPFVAMEYVTGVTLGQWRRQRPRSVRDILRVMAAVARGLQAAHAARVVHRDVKPGNILVDGQRVLVTDFGLSVRDGGGAAGTVAGTPGYMAPEQCRGEPATTATDVFGFCATLHEMLHLRRPFGTGSFAEVSARVMAGQVERPPRRIAVPGHVGRLLQAGLAADPVARPSSMARIAELLADPGRRARRAAIAVLAATAVLGALWVGRELRTRSRPQVVSGPAWVQPLRRIPPTFFGVTVKSATGVMPGFQVGAVRLWDGHTRWANIEPAPGQLDWGVLDRMVASASHAGLPVLFTLGGTPAWAAPRAPRTPYADGSRAAAPDQLSSWASFLTALTTRYGDRIEAYETWVLGNDPHFFNGPVETLVEMTGIASRIIRANAPGATVVCPGMGRLWSEEGRQVMLRFAELGGYHHCDAASVKLHGRSASDPPETMIELVTIVDRVLHQAGVHPPLWNTGTAYEFPLATRLDEASAVNHAARFFLAGLYARLPRTYFYNWGASQLPVVLQAEGGAPTAAARAVEQLERWLASAGLRSCGQGSAIGLPDNVWECRLTLTRGARRPGAAIRWTHQGTAVTSGDGAVLVHPLGGTPARWPPGKPITVTEQPILIETK